MKIRATTKLEITLQFEDIDTLDVDTISFDGYNRQEIAEAVIRLLTIDGIPIYGKIHKFRLSFLQNQNEENQKGKRLISETNKPILLSKLKGGEKYGND